MFNLRKCFKSTTVVKIIKVILNSKSSLVFNLMVSFDVEHALLIVLVILAVIVD